MREKKKTTFMRRFMSRHTPLSSANVISPHMRRLNRQKGSAVCAGVAKTNDEQATNCFSYTGFGDRSEDDHVLFIAVKDQPGHPSLQLRGRPNMIKSGKSKVIVIITLGFQRIACSLLFFFLACPFNCRLTYEERHH